MLSDVNVVTDLYEIIDLNTAFDHGVIKGAAIDCRARPDFDIIAELRCAELRHPYPTVAVLREAEPVATDNGAWMDQHPISESGPVTDGDSRHEVAVRADPAATLDDTAGTEY
jgi:hypothetical protein